MGKTFSTGLLTNGIWQDSSNNVGIGAAANASFKLQVTGTTNLTGALSGTSASFSNNGLFGGSTNPGNAATYTLSVGLAGTNTGGIQLWSPTNSAHYIQFGDSTTAADNYRGYIGYNHATDTLILGTASADRLTIASTGAATFSAASGGAITLTTLGTANNWTSAITGNSTTSQSYGLLIQAGSNSTDAALRVRNQANSLDWLFVRGDGNVGIGITSPGRLLSLYKSSTPILQFVDDISGTGASNGFLLYNAGLDAYLQNTSNGFMAFYTNDTERMRITSGGNVGIGNTGASDVRLLIKAVDTTGSNYGLIVNNSSNANLLFVRNDGLILTGSSSASPYNLSTTGRNAVIESNGVLGYLVSTRESKANIKTIENVDFINQLNPVSFNYRKKDYNTNTFTDELYDNITYGFIADEVEQVNKELVMYNQDGSLGGVEYNSIIAILTKAVQELEARIKQLENK